MTAPSPATQLAARGPAQGDKQADESIRDLMGLLALPALWAGKSGEAVLRIMVEAVERIVPLKCVFAQATLLAEQPQFRLLRINGSFADGQSLDDWQEAAQSWISRPVPDGRKLAAETPAGRMNLIRLRLGYGAYGGEIWFGSEEPDFPAMSQLAFLRAAASLAATGVQSARADYEREQASRAKDEFLAMLGHELRNPLAPITTALELLRLRNQGQMTAEHLIIERQATHLSRLVDDLLDVTRITRGKIELRKEATQIREALSRAIEDTSPLMRERSHTLLSCIPETSMQVYGDSTRLTQIFSNLLINAAKYTDPGGRIELTVQTDDGDELTVSIKDNGTGISPELYPRLFNIFEQSTDTMERAKGGLGIGLALVKKFVELHGGTVTACSKGPGHGSEFLVRLPLMRSPQSKEHSRMTDNDLRRAESPLKILLVDDNADALASISASLTELGHEVSATEDPVEALALARRLSPEVAVLDIGLPVMNGYELATELRKIFPSHALRLIALTGYGQTKDHSNSVRAGFDMHLVKPVTLQSLVAAMMTEQDKAPAQS